MLLQYRTNTQYNKLKSEYKNLQFDLQGIADQMRALLFTKTLLIRNYPNKNNFLSKLLFRNTSKSPKLQTKNEPKLGKSMIMIHTEKEPKTDINEISAYEVKNTQIIENDKKIPRNVVTCVEKDNSKNELQIVINKIEGLQKIEEEIIQNMQQKATEIEELETEINDHKFRLSILKEQIKNMEQKLIEISRNFHKEILVDFKANSHIKINIY